MGLHIGYIKPLYARNFKITFACIMTDKSPATPLSLQHASPRTLQKHLAFPFEDTLLYEYL